MRLIAIYTTLSLGLFVSACTGSEDPQLAMCQSVTKYLTDNKVSNWNNIEQNDARRLRTIDIQFEQADGSNGTISCGFPIQENDTVETAPSVVTLNGEKVGTKELFKAGAKASAEMLKGTAANTVARTKVLASDAVIKAKEAAGEASEIASDLTEKAKETASDAADIASDVAEKAKIVASDVADKAKKAALDTTKSIQQKLEN